MKLRLLSLAAAVSLLGLSMGCLYPDGEGRRDRRSEPSHEQEREHDRDRGREDHHDERREPGHMSGLPQ